MIGSEFRLRIEASYAAIRPRIWHGGSPADNWRKRWTEFVWAKQGPRHPVAWPGIGASALPRKQTSTRPDASDRTWTLDIIAPRALAWRSKGTVARLMAPWSGPLDRRIVPAEADDRAAEEGADGRYARALDCRAVRAR